MTSTYGRLRSAEAAPSGRDLHAHLGVSDPAVLVLAGLARRHDHDVTGSRNDRPAPELELHRAAQNLEALGLLRAYALAAQPAVGLQFEVVLEVLAARVLSGLPRDQTLAVFGFLSHLSQNPRSGPD